MLWEKTDYGSRWIACWFPSRCGTEACSEIGDYHGQMNSTNFEKWVREKMLQNLPPSSVVVLDNVPYHSVQADKAPSKYSVKSEMISWLQRHGVFCDPAMRKGQL
ncbi:hypothetical protein L798_11352 [Zootermopsis nevadensis]|uniref:Tc1-like transposase DDE domain-containing protein n=1 Tax=Zootermopsis nevadensis TaxID=136037 RepID=A0A067RL85_ZOONE|nr:hypothetical protein L798_11352 [Zootermopsis nevadensis]